MWMRWRAAPAALVGKWSCVSCSRFARGAFSVAAEERWISGGGASRWMRLWGGLLRKSGGRAAALHNGLADAAVEDASRFAGGVGYAPRGNVLRSLKSKTSARAV